MTTTAQPRTLSLADYAAELPETGVRVFARTSEDFWIRYESLSLMRIPSFVTTPPAPATLTKLLWSTRALVASYVLNPDETHPANAWLYVCSDQNYSVDKLPAAARRNARRGSRELRIEPVSADSLLANGFQAYSDTRARVGVSDGTREVFTKRFESRGKCRGHVYLGAWHEQELIAFLSITEVDNWAEIEGCFSANAGLALRPNDTLMVAALTHYLTVKRCALVSYGLSSIQSVSTAAGLHEFKTKVGFEAKPVHRAFVVHPLFRPMVNGVAQRCVSALLGLTPDNRLLKKCDGMLSTMLGRRTLVGT